MRRNTTNLRILKDTPPWEWPRGTGKVLLDVLRDDRSPEPDLLLATELAGDFTVINDELVDALLSILRSSDKPEAIRAESATALGPVLDYADAEGFEEAGDVPIAEHTFHGIRELLRRLYADASIPKEVRRRILEASVRAPEDWHRDAIRAAHVSDDRDWRLTAVFCMSFVRGFDEQILEELNSNDPDIRYEAVRAAGVWQLDAAWPHVAALVASPQTDKRLLLAAIESVAAIRPRDAARILDDLADSEDEEIGAAVEDAMVMAGGSLEDDDEDLEDDDDPLF